MIEVRGLTHRYGPLTAVDDLSLRVERGQLVGLLGPNGAGKSTTLRAIAGLLTPTAGQVRIGGHDIARSPLAARRQLGYLPESVSLYLELTVIEFLRFVGQAKGLPRGEAWSEAERVIPLAGLEMVRNRVIGYCSRGYRQRIGLAHVLVGDPPALVLDEPTVGLDPAQIADVRTRIAELAQDRAVILSTHILPEASRLCDKVLILNQGRCVGFDDLDHLAHGVSKHNEVDVFLEEAPVDIVPTLAGAPFEVIAQSSESSQLKLRLRLTTTDRVGDAVSFLVGAGLCVGEVRPRRAGLEEVFLQLVHDDPGTAQGDP
jgi:gliding motility-associated transport system ATP-binding protein